MTLSILSEVRAHSFSVFLFLDSKLFFLVDVSHVRHPFRLFASSKSRHLTVTIANSDAVSVLLL